MGHNKPNLTTPKKAPENMLAGNFLYDVIAYEEYWGLILPPYRITAEEIINYKSCQLRFILM